MTGFPAPGSTHAEVAVAAPGPGPGNWTGASSAAYGPEGELVIAYRVRTRDRRGAAVIVARVGGNTEVTAVCTLEKERFGAESLERPALVHNGDGWRIYMSCATPGTKHWRIDALDARDPSRFGESKAVTVFPGSEVMGVKDPVIRRSGGAWHAWICCHPLEDPGEEDRMTTAYASSADGLDWRWMGDVLRGRPGRWDSRGARVTSVLPGGRAYYDGRASKEENFSECTGIASPEGAHGRLIAEGDAPVANVRYLDVVPISSGGHLAFYERPRPDGSHELCVETWPL